MVTFHTSHSTFRASLVAERVKNLSAMWENQIRSLGWEEALEKEGIGNPLQYSCLENPMDRGACWVTGSQRVRHD